MSHSWEQYALYQNRTSPSKDVGSIPASLLSVPDTAHGTCWKACVQTIREQHVLLQYWECMAREAPAYAMPVPDMTE
eukprot:3941266-Rhodomonas_salina.8